MRFPREFCIVLMWVVGLAAGCTKSAVDQQPSFTLAWSEYPSWSVFDVAHQQNLIHKEAGKLGPIEEKWGVDVVLKQADYDTCLQLYGSGACDAVCITNMDSLNPALAVSSVAVLPTSTSVGADACIAAGIPDVEQLRAHKVYGLEKSVSEYCFVRNLEKLGESEANHQFTNMDPGAAATAMQTQQGDVQAIMVWNPFVLQTLKTRKDAKVLFDSSSIPEEIIDMVVVSQAALQRPGGEFFAAAVVETFYAVNQRLAGPETRDDTLMAISAKFAELSLEEMNTVVEQTRFYSTPQEGLALFEGANLKETMQIVVDFCIKHGIVEGAPTIGYGGATTPPAQLRFDPSYMKGASKGRS